MSRSKTTLAITSLALGLFLTACDNSEAVKEEKKEAPLAPVQQEQSMQPPAATGQELGDFIPPTQERVTQFSAKAMTIPYSITLGVALGEEEQENVQRLIDLSFAEIDKIYNKWNPDSELSAVNQGRGGVKIAISRELERFLLEVDQVVRLSDGLFDPTMLPLQDLWQAHLEEGRIPFDWEIEELETAVGWDKLEIGNGFVRKAHDKTAVDLGGIAKGFAVDRLVERLGRTGYDDVLVEWGGEIRCAGEHPEGRPWTVFISRLGDSDPRHAIDTLALSNVALATSGDYEQQWKLVVDGQERVFSHVIDPRTLRALEITSESIASTSVLAPNCMLADALATSAMLQASRDEAQGWAEKMQASIQGTAFWIVSRQAQR